MDYIDEGHDVSMRYPQENWRRKLIVQGDALVKRRLLSWVDDTPVRRILDIGAGNAVFSLEVAKKTSSSELHVLDAVDFSHEWTQLQEATSIAIKGIVHDLDNPLPYPDDMFDIVLSNQVVEHLYDPIGHLREIKRVLHPTGYAMVGTCNLSSIQYRLELLFGRTPTTLGVGLYKYMPNIMRETPHVTKFARHISCLTFRDFRKLLRAEGYRISGARTSVIYILPALVERFITRFLPLGNYMTFKVVDDSSSR